MLDTGSVRISLCDNGTLEINDGGAIYALSEPETTAMLKWLAARHRTAAETVGADEAVTALDPSNHEVKVTAKIHELCLERGAENVSTMELAAVLFRNRLPTPPATQSALEQAREAVEFARDEIGYAGNKRICDALAALAAVLPPAKGGAGV